MIYVNECEIQDFADKARRGDDPLLLCAALTLQSLHNAVNTCSDGWPYWQAPSKAAQHLIALLQARAHIHPYDPGPAQTTVAELTRAYAPIKAFVTRYGAKYGFAVDFHQPVRQQPGPTPAQLELTPL